MEGSRGAVPKMNAVETNSIFPIHWVTHKGVLEISHTNFLSLKYVHLFSFGLDPIRENGEGEGEILRLIFLHNKVNSIFEGNLRHR